MSENSSPRSSSSQSYDHDASIYGDDVASMLRASIHKSLAPFQRECSKEISKKLEWEFENDIFKMYFKKFPLALTELCRLMQKSDDNLHILKSGTHRLMDQGFNIIMESEMCQEYFKKVEEFIEQKSIFNQRLKQQRETGEQEFEKIKAYYYELQSDSTSQSEALKHASKKLVNINQRFSLCEDALRETDTLLEKIQASLESAKVQDLDNVERYEEISEALEKTRILVSGWSEKIERLEFESNIMKTDLKSLENSSPDPNSKNGHLKKSPEDQTKAGLIKVAEPVMLSTHLYIEALEQKVREVNELKRAFLELAVAATDERIKSEVDLKFNDKGNTSYQNQYIADALKKVKARLEKNSQKDKDDEFKRILKAEKSKYEDLFGRFKKEVSERRYIHNKLQDLKGNVRVYCRVRNFIKEEKNSVPNQNDPYLTFPDAHTIRIRHLPQKRDLSFELNHVFTTNDDQSLIFDEVNPLISSVCDGYNACIMAYGQTGSGKTYTMVGNEIEPGVIPRAVNRIFEVIKEREGDYEYQVCLSIVEIYNEQVRDLLASNTSAKIDIKDINGTINLMPCLIAPSIQNQSQAFQIIHKGESNRTTGSTLMNEYSSRSHLIVKFTVLSTNKVTQKSYTSSLNLIDLAGSERLYKSESEGERMKEACHINQSLVTLGKVLNALALKQPHVPYRESKLTHLLKESLGGDSKTLMIIQVSPDSKELSETLSTLQFGTHVMKIEKGKPKSCILQEVDTNSTAHHVVAKSMVFLPSSPAANDNNKMKVSKSTHSLKLDSPPTVSSSVNLKDQPVVLQLKESNQKEKDKENGSSAKAQAPPVQNKAVKVSSFIKPGTATLPKKGRSATLTDANQLVHVIDVARFRRDGNGMDVSKQKVNTSFNNLK